MRAFLFLFIVILIAGCGSSIEDKTGADASNSNNTTTKTPNNEISSSTKENNSEKISSPVEQNELSHNDDELTNTQENKKKLIGNRLIPLSKYKRKKLSIGEKKIDVYLAESLEERAEGLMYVQDNDLKTNEGMFFIFEEESYLMFWMKNTYIPLDIAFIDKTGKIVNIKTMKPHDQSQYASDKLAKFALEMKAGWFEKNNIKAGDTVDVSFVR